MKHAAPLFRRWFGLPLAIILLLMTMTTGCAQEKVLKIGYITEQTGVDAFIGPASVPALEDKIAEINNGGGNR